MTSDDSMSSPCPKPLPKSIFGSFAVLGGTLGLYVGWSQSPVVGAMVTGVLGLLSGGSLIYFTGTTEEKRLSQDDLRLVSRALMLFCACSIVGTIVGIVIRTSTALSSATDVPEVLVSITGESDGLSSGNALKLLLLQQALDNVGVAVGENNRIIKLVLEQELVHHEKVKLQTTRQLNGLKNYIKFLAEVPPEQSIAESTLTSVYVGSGETVKYKVDDAVADLDALMKNLERLRGSPSLEDVDFLLSQSGLANALKNEPSTTTAVVQTSAFAPMSGTARKSQ